MPVGSYKDFAACIADQKKKGHSEDSANRICGEIEKRSREGETVDGDMDKRMADMERRLADMENKIRDMMGEDGDDMMRGESAKTFLKESADWRRIEFVAPITEFVSAKESNGDFLIRGVAINETTTRNGITYTAEELEKSAASFCDKPLLKDHNNSVDSIVGRTTQNVHFDSKNRNLMFEARIVDPLIQHKIEAGLIKNVSIGSMVEDIEEVEVTGQNDEVTKQLIARGIEGVEISLVAVPADKNATFTKAIAESFGLKRKSGEVKLDMNLIQQFKASLENIEHGRVKTWHSRSSSDSASVDNKQDNVGGENLMVETKVEVAALDALREERMKIEQEIEQLKLEKLKAERDALAKSVTETKTHTKPVVEDKTKGIVGASEKKEINTELPSNVVLKREGNSFFYTLHSYDPVKHPRLFCENRFSKLMKVI